jgi:outer membrane protein
MKNFVFGAFAAALLGTVALPAFAADLPSTKAAPTLSLDDSSFDPYLVRARALGVLPDASGSSLRAASLTNNVVPEVDLTYFLTKHWAVEVIAGITHHELKSAGAYVANTTLLPPTATLQYHFALGQLDPYLGVGANYTWFLETKPSPITVRPAAGLALQAGFDYYLTKHWVLNVDAKKLFLESDAYAGGVAPIAHVNVNPWLVGVGVGYRFGGSEAAPVVAKY